MQRQASLRVSGLDNLENEISRVSAGTVEAVKCQCYCHQRHLYHFHHDMSSG